MWNCTNDKLTSIARMALSLLLDAVLADSTFIASDAKVIEWALKLTA